MPPTGTIHRARVSPETRQLVLAAALALLALWLLARVRYPDAPTLTAMPLPPLLAQLAPAPARLTDLSAEMASTAERIRNTVSAVTVTGSDGLRSRLAVPIAAGIGATIVPGVDPMSVVTGAQTLASDRPTGTVLVAVQPPAAVTAPRAAPQRGEPSSTYAIAASAAGLDRVDVRPVYLSVWPDTTSAAWGARLLAMRPDTLETGTLLFTLAEELLGIVSRQNGRSVLVPAPAFLQRAEAMVRATEPTGTGRIGLHVTTLTPALAAATGTSSGVLVLAVDRDGPAYGQVEPGDAVTAIDDQPVDGVEAWTAIADRVRAGVELQVRRVRRQSVAVVDIRAAPFALPSVSGLGATLKRAAQGTQVVSLQPGSAARDAGLLPGDVIVRVGDVTRPSPAEVHAVLRRDDTAPVLVLFIRDGIPQATAISR